MHRQLFYKLQLRQTAPAGKPDIIGKDIRHRREVLGSLNKKMEIYSIKFSFNHVNGICLVAYQAKKNKNPVMLLSSSHANNLVATNETKN